MPPRPAVLCPSDLRESRLSAQPDLMAAITLSSPSPANYETLVDVEPCENTGETGSVSPFSPGGSVAGFEAVGKDEPCRRKTQLVDPELEGLAGISLHHELTKS